MLIPTLNSNRRDSGDGRVCPQCPVMGVSVQSGTMGTPWGVAVALSPLVSDTILNASEKTHMDSQTHMRGSAQKSKVI